jgi:hypothetical protein
MDHLRRVNPHALVLRPANKLATALLMLAVAVTIGTALELFNVPYLALLSDVPPIAGVAFWSISALRIVLSRDRLKSAIFLHAVDGWEAQSWYIYLISAYKTDRVTAFKEIKKRIQENDAAQTPEKPYKRPIWPSSTPAIDPGVPGCGS